jgi:membrane protein implicated in regulation of membrane protease activity
MQHGTTVLVTVLGIAVGVAAVVAGGADDSPGLQGLGVLVVVAAVVYGVRRVRRSG